MANSYKTPGVYIKEISKFPPSIATVDTAIPAFIGYTLKHTLNGEDLTNKAIRIKSLIEFESIFGGACNEKFSATLITEDTVDKISAVSMNSTFTYRMYYSLRLYFANGGGSCYIISVGGYSATPTIDHSLLAAGLAPLAKEDEPTLILFPDAISITGAGAVANFYNLYINALQQCADLGDRFAICDIYQGNLDFQTPGGTNVINDASDGFRTNIGNNNLKYGAAYYPWLKTTYNFSYDETAVTVSGGSMPASTTMKNATESKSLFHLNNALYNELKNEINKNLVTLGAACAMAGVYARVDATRGVWKAPANVSLTEVMNTTVLIDDAAQALLNVDSTGKSVNAIRPFTGKGIMVWGARTLAGNDNEWRYIPVRRYYNMVEESTKKASGQFVFEPNDANTWVKVRTMIENFLTLQWRSGAMAGSKPEEAFFVKVGLGETMTPQDILEGRMIVEIGMAVVRPAEFIILKFSHKMQEA